jgi:hypothetical protein
VDTIVLTNTAFVCCAVPQPIITLALTNQTVEYSSNAFLAIDATGTPPLACCWFFDTNAIAGATNLTLTIPQVDYSMAGAYSVRITNAYGCATSGPVILSVIDTVPPTITACATNATLSAGLNCDALLPDLTGQVAASDASGAVSVAQEPPPGTVLGLGPTNITFTASDSSSNSSTCTATITVADTTPPAILSLVTDLQLVPDANCLATLPDLTVTNYIVAQDTCSSVTITQAPSAGTLLSFGTNLVTLTALDAAGNATNCSVLVIVSCLPPAFQTVSQADGLITFSWNAITGRVYQLQYQTDLVQTGWTDMGAPVTAADSTLSASDAIAPDPQRFYRVVLMP